MKKLIFIYLIINALIFGLAATAAAQAKKGKAKPKPPRISLPSGSALSNDEIVFGIKDALSNGVNRASSALSRQGGFYGDPRIKLLLPPEMQEVEKKLRALKFDDMVNDFVVAMNRAAEQSVVEASFAFSDSIRDLKIQDGKKLLAGPKDAATQYFRRASETVLPAKVRPLVNTAVAEADVLTQYKMLQEKAGIKVTAPDGQKPFDISDYITQKTLDGMFLIMAEEEKRIREEPAARTTIILKKVFGN